MEDFFLATPQLAVVADGVGGGPAGHIASELAVRTLDLALVGRPATVDGLREAVQQAAAALYGASFVDPSLDGMATTMDAVVLGAPAPEATVHGLHIGDGAVWIVAEGEPPRQVTTAHRAPSGMLEFALTTDLTIEFETWTETLEPGDRLVLATNGFFGPTGTQHAARQLVDVRGLSAADAARALVRAALGAGGRDKKTSSWSTSSTTRAGSDDRDVAVLDRVTSGRSSLAPVE